MILYNVEIPHVIINYLVFLLFLVDLYLIYLHYVSQIIIGVEKIIFCLCLHKTIQR